MGSISVRCNVCCPERERERTPFYGNVCVSKLRVPHPCVARRGSLKFRYFWCCVKAPTAQNLFKINTPLMPKKSFPIENKFVIAVTSSALFDMTESNRVFEEEGREAYQRYQQEHRNDVLRPGVAFPFIKRLLALNELLKGDTKEDMRAWEQRKFIEVVLFSRNNPATGSRVFYSIKHYELDISRACFSSGSTNFQYLGAFNSVLYLSTNVHDVQGASDAGFAAGHVQHNPSMLDNDTDTQLRVAFDFDGVLADPSAELVAQEKGLEGFSEHEVEYAAIPLSEGPLTRFLQSLSKLKELLKAQHPDKEPIRTALITARNAPAHERVITTLAKYGVDLDEVFFLGGINKAHVLEVFRPHLFFDDKLTNLQDLTNIPSVHIMLSPEMGTAE